LAAVGLLGALYGYFVHRNHWPPYALAERAAKSLSPAKSPGEQRGGMWNRAPDSSGSAGDAPARDDASLRQLEAIGYAGGIERGPSGRGVTVHDAGRVAPGWNLYHCGHAPEASLIDAGGNVVHQWRFPYAQAFPDDNSPPHYTKDFWRRVQVLPNGDLLAIFEGRGLIRIDRGSRLLWAKLDRAHHQAVVGPAGEIYVLTRTARVVPELHRGEPLLEDFITVLSAEGELLRQVSLFDALHRSNFSGLVSLLAPDGSFHTNAVQLLAPGAPLPGAADASALVSFRELNSIAVVDLARETVTWALSGFTLHQHDPTLLANGHLLIFDNRDAERGSRVVEVDPATQALVWEYPTGFAAPFSSCCGAAQRLENGNTLITFTQTAAALEVTPEGAVVWEFHSPHRTGANDEFVAQLMELRRIPPEFFVGWSPGAPGTTGQR
jgi:arylsulfotransferase ASST